MNRKPSSHRWLPRKRLLWLLNFSTGFWNAATVLPLLVVLPVMIYAGIASSKRKIQPRGDWSYIAGVICGLVFLGALTYLGLNHPFSNALR